MPPADPPSGAPRSGDPDGNAGDVNHRRVAPWVNAPVVVAPHDVTDDPDRRLWLCDIAVNTGAAY